jgi:hypothetical protein
MEVTCLFETSLDIHRITTRYIPVGKISCTLEALCEKLEADNLPEDNRNVEYIELF